MGSVFEYTNFRQLLKDYYEERKSQNPLFSFKMWANRAGFKSKSFLPHVIEGKKNLSKASIFKLGRSMKLGEKALAYFEDLVAFNQAKDLDERNHFYAKLASYNVRNRARMIRNNQFDLYNVWYHNTIRELVTIVDFRGDYKYLGRMVRPSISAAQAKASVKMLLELGLIKRTRTGTGFIQSDQAISTGDEVQSLAIQNFHVQNLVQAADTLSVCPVDERDVSALVVGLSNKGFKSIKNEIQLFRKRLTEIVNKDEPANRVYHINFQLLPTSEKKEDGR